MEPVKMDDHTGHKKTDSSDDEYVKVERLDGYMELGTVDDDVEYVKVDCTYSDLETETPLDDSENSDAEDDMENEGTDDSENSDAEDDMENEATEDSETSDAEDDMENEATDDSENSDAEDDMENEATDDSENSDAEDDMENERTDEDVEGTDEDVEVRDPYDDVLFNKRIFYPFTRSTRVVEIKDLVKDIVLPYLPAKSISRFKSVSKEWDERIKNPFLSHQQSYYFKNLSGFFLQSRDTQHTFVTLDQTAYGVPKSNLGSFLPESVTLLSSCNGLILCKGREPDEPYYVCNPATQEWTMLPSPTVFPGYESPVFLAFEPSALNMEAHYRLLRVLSVYGCVYFDIYSSETNTWKLSGTSLVGFGEMSITDNWFYMNGIVYMETSDFSTRSVIAFDLFSEVYEVIPLPSECPTDGVLTQIEGELCYVGVSRYTHTTDEYSIMVYAGMDLSLKSQVRASIRPKSSFDRHHSHRVVPCLDGKNVMVLVGDGTIYSCSTSDGSVEVATTVKNGFSVTDKYLPYVNSLVLVRVA